MLLTLLLLVLLLLLLLLVVTISRLQLCMAQGIPVVLVHCESLFESLYDLLNQHYVEYGGQVRACVRVNTCQYNVVFADTELEVIGWTRVGSLVGHVTRVKPTILSTHPNPRSLANLRNES